MLDVVSFLQQLVRCKSVTPVSDGAIELMEQTLTKIGFTVEIIEFTDKDSYPVKNLYASIGDGEEVLAFCGHLDVVPTGEISRWTVDPFAGEIVNGRLIARGSEDMKGGVACFTSALANFIPQFNLQKGKILVLLTLDEEQEAVNGIKKLIAHVVEQKKQKISACLLAEPTNINKIGDCIKIGRRGSINFNIKVKGKQGHVAYQHLAKNPMPIASKILSDLNNLKLAPANQDFESSNLEISGVKSSTETYNIIPESIEIRGNIRYNNQYKLADIKKVIEDVVLVHQDAELMFRNDASEPFMVDPNSDFCQKLEAAIVEVTGIKPSKDTKGGTSDARFLKNYTKVIEFGLIEKTLHQVDENVATNDLLILSNIYENFLNKFFI
ncbi:succinyl-diaminopimelate desuccinylase [Rickettsiales bacterium LUAb2]